MDGYIGGVGMTEEIAKKRLRLRQMICCNDPQKEASERRRK